MEDTVYDHYVAVDWAAENMAIARMTKKSNKITAVDVDSDIKELRFYLDNLKGKKILTIEETTTAQWLYTELKDCVDRIIVCDPRRNHLLKEGAKTDKIDAVKLVRLLKAGLLKEVYHSNDRFVYLRKLVSGYEDIVKAGVRVKNQRYALLRGDGKNGFEKEGVKPSSKDWRFVLESMDRQIKVYKEEKSEYEKEFRRLSGKHPEIKNQKSIPGIGVINAVKIVARVVTPYRFADKGHYLSYAGLVKHDKVSGGRSYGKKNPQYCRMMKNIYKTGALAAIGGNNPISDYHEYLIKEKGYAEHNARNKVSRRLAILSLGVFKSGEKYHAYNREYIKDDK